ncbi:hypothetical protein FE257_007113 [Aspergillus nanangensis]|uniref:Uncharacterized protein n=1 Tax=Aspergillus nanangensis TaxID=2582783 RepID=A0AAD4CN68_ASPNN|nr:hypothetical protein FE257_007113 [Aspergillus nanangensis]
MSRGRDYNDIRESLENRPRIVTGRRATDTEYDIRAPRAHPKPTSPTSHYGPNFQNSAQGRSSSYAYGDRKEPNIPDPYVKRPEEWPAKMVKEYYGYKEHEDAYRKAKRDFSDSKTNYPKTVRNESDVQKVRQGLVQIRDAKKAVGREAMARGGFDQKYPCAYEDLKAKGTHQGVFNRNMNSVRNLKIEENQFERRLHGAQHGYRR